MEESYQCFGGILCLNSDAACSSKHWYPSTIIHGIKFNTTIILKPTKVGISKYLVSHLVHLREQSILATLSRRLPHQFLGCACQLLEQWSLTALSSHTRSSSTTGGTCGWPKARRTCQHVSDAGLTLHHPWAQGGHLSGHRISQFHKG
jgi:hypothetical protein